MKRLAQSRRRRLLRELDQMASRCMRREVTSYSDAGRDFWSKPDLFGLCLWPAAITDYLCVPEYATVRHRARGRVEALR
jgi:hypothetical protein